MANLNSILHPHHVSLMRTPFTLQSLFHSFEDRVDPYFEYDAVPSHRGIGRPRFNVTETEDIYILDGEFPGVSDKSNISVEWLQNQVLIIRGVIDPADTETATDPFKAGLQNDLPAATKHIDAPPVAVGKIEIEAMNRKPAVKFPRRLLNERRIGEVERSFTFPTEVDADHTKASLTDGLLRIVVSKKVDVAKKSRSIEVM